MPAVTCQQVSCHLDATHVFTWPGHFEAPICRACLVLARNAAWALGFDPDVFLNVKPLPVEGALPTPEGAP